MIRRDASVFNSFTIRNTYTVNYEVKLSKSPYYKHTFVLQYLLKRPKSVCLKFHSWLNGKFIYFKV